MPCGNTDAYPAGLDGVSCGVTGGGGPIGSRGCTGFVMSVSVVSWRLVEPAAWLGEPGRNAGIEMRACRRHGRKTHEVTDLRAGRVRVLHVVHVPGLRRVDRSGDRHGHVVTPRRVGGAPGVDLLHRPRVQGHHVRCDHRGFLDGVAGHPGEDAVSRVDDGHVLRGEHVGGDREPGSRVGYGRGAAARCGHLLRRGGRRVWRPVRHGYSSPFSAAAAFAGRPRGRFGASSASSNGANRIPRPPSSFTAGWLLARTWPFWTTTGAPSISATNVSSATCAIF